MRILAFILFAGFVAGSAYAQDGLGACVPVEATADQARHLVLTETYQDAEREIRDVRFSADSRLLAVAANDGYAQVREIDTGRILMRTSRFEYPIWHVGFSQDGRRVVTYVTGDGPDHLYVWDVASGNGQVTRDLSISYGLMTAPDYSATSPDGARSYQGGRLYDPRTNAEVASIRTVISNATPLFSNDSRVFVIAAPFESRAFDAQSGQLTARLCGTDNSVPPRISGEGRFLASVENSHAREPLQIAIWDTHTGSVIARLSAPPQSIWALDISPDGRLLATGSIDGSVRVWRVADGAGEAPEISEVRHAIGGSAASWMRWVTQMSLSNALLIAAALFAIVLVVGLVIRRLARNKDARR